MQRSRHVPSRARRPRALAAAALAVTMGAFALGAPAAPTAADRPPAPSIGQPYFLVPRGEALPADAVALRELPGGTLCALRGSEPTTALFVLRSLRGARDDLAGDPQAWAGPRGVRVLWTNGEFALLDASDPAALDLITPEGYDFEVLEARPDGEGRENEGSPVSPPLPPAPATTPFEALVDAAVSRVHPDSIHQWISELSGAESTLVGGEPYLSRTRYTHASGGRKAEQWCYERFASLGLAVEYESVPVGSTSARNVIATLPGKVTPKRIYVIGGHLDDTSPQAMTLAPGAEDNASGTIGVVEAARVLKDFGFDSTIRFIGFTGEEQGLHGSNRNAANARARGDSIFGVVIMDMIGWQGTTYRLTIEGQPQWDSLMTVMADACDRYTALSTEKTYVSFGSDHVPFQNRGYAAFLAIEDEYASYPGYHQISDTLGNLSMTQTADVVRAAVATVAHLAHPLDATLVRMDPSAFSGTGDAGRLEAAAAEPNPFRSRTRIPFRLAHGGSARLAVYDVSGRLVATVLDEWLSAGPHVIEWDGMRASGGPAPAGVYLYYLEQGGSAAAGRMTRLR